MKKRLEKLLSHKKSLQYYADILTKEFNTLVTIEDVKELKKDIDCPKVIVGQQPLTTQQLETLAGIDNTTSFLKESKQRSYKDNTWTYSLDVIYTQEQVDKTDLFMKFLETYQSSYKEIKSKQKSKIKLNRSGLVINKQDFHLNKKDEEFFENNLKRRIDEYESHIDLVLERANLLSSLENITYVIGSDYFNSEINNMTVKGTPQTNLEDYHLTFEIACNHEVNIISKFLEQSLETINIIFLIGNHDACVSFHLVSWLKAFYRKEKRVNIDVDPSYTKYFSIYDTAFCINHGDVQKPIILAQNFPFEYKRGFSEANFHVILTGDKHKELSKDLGGIKFYQIPALSKAKSRWDLQNGYTTTKAESTTFLIEEGLGITTIFKNVII